METAACPRLWVRFVAIRHILAAVHPIPIAGIASTARKMSLDPDKDWRRPARMAGMGCITE
jgi:hypothetical protein